MNPHRMHAPGFYKTNPRAIGIRELIRWRGLWRLPLALLVTRRMNASGGLWMPLFQADIECAREDLSERFWQMTAGPRETLGQLGFSEYCTVKTKSHQNLNPGLRDSGSIHYVHADRSHLAGISYIKSYARPPIDREREHVIVAFAAGFAQGSLICTNSDRGFEPRSGETLYRFNGADAATLHDRFLKALKRRGGTPLVFPDRDSLRRYSDECHAKRFESGVRRGLFVRMTDDEVAVARRKLPPPLPETETARR